MSAGSRVACLIALGLVLELEADISVSCSRHGRAPSRLQLPELTYTSRMRLRGGAALSREEEERQSHQKVKEFSDYLANLEEEIKVEAARNGDSDPFDEEAQEFKHNAEVYSYPEADELDDMEPRPASLQDIPEAMKVVQGIQEVLTEWSPEGIADMCKKSNISISDLEPSLSLSGKRAGNLTDLEAHRLKMQDQIDEIRATFAELRHEMKQTQPVEELKNEIEEMRQKGQVNPYIELLHEWQKNKDHEHESGAFTEQFKARQKALQKVDPSKAPQAPTQPIAPQVTAPPIASQNSQDP